MRLVVSLLAIALAMAPQLSVSTSATMCGQEVQASLGYCPSISDGGSSLTVSGTQQRPGAPAVPNTPGTPEDRDATPAAPDAPAAPAPPSDHAIRLAACLDDGGTVRCSTLTTPTEASPDAPIDPSAPATPTITLADLARFAPAPTDASAEPGNVGIAGLPANFTTAADVHTRSGEIFGIPLTVRFTPVTYLYDYGDGAVVTLSAPGRTWEELGQPQFTLTPTSHVYRERGEYTAHVDVHYSVEIDLGTGWVPVSGQITTAGAPQTIRILEAHTALVAHTCAEDPGGIGC